MKFRDMGLDGPKLIDLEPKEDSRGFFSRLFCMEEFAGQGLKAHWKQINNSLTQEKGTVRGLHFQRPPSAEVKLVRCIRGVIFDVAVDLRADSPTYGQWCGAQLTADNRSMLYIPEGFAHGFQTLTPDAEVCYLISAYHVPDAATGIRHDAPWLAIPWPLPVSVISERDRQWPHFADAWVDGHAHVSAIA